MKTNRRKFILTSLALGSTILMPLKYFSVEANAAGALGVVFDPTNFAQNLISAINSIRQTINSALQVRNQITGIINQITSLQNEAQSLINEGKNLISLPASIQSDVMNNIHSLENIFTNSKSVVLDYKTLQTQFDTVFKTPNYKGMSGAQINQRTDKMIDETINAANDALIAQGLVADISKDKLSLDSMLTASKSAEGVLSATQASNEISSMLVEQLMRMQTMMAENNKSQTVQAIAKIENSKDLEAKHEKKYKFKKRKATTPVNNKKFLNPIGKKK